VILCAVWPLDLNENSLCFWCAAKSDQGLTLIGGSFEIKHSFLRRAKGVCKEGNGRPPTYGRALPAVSWRAVTVSSLVGLLPQVCC